MTDNSDFASRPQHPDGSTNPTPPAPQHSPYARPQEHDQPADTAAETTAQGDQPTAGSPAASDAQPTAAYPLAPDMRPATTDPHGAPDTDTTTADTTADTTTADTTTADTDRRKNSKTVPLVVAALAVGAIAGGVSGAGIASLAVNNARTGTSIATPTTVTVNQPEDATLVTGAAAVAAPSTVTLYVTAEIGAGSGSGVVISEDGYIITNSHVVTLGGAVADPLVQVQTWDGRLLDATVVGRDPIADIAVVKVDATDLQPAEFADSDELNVGDTAVVLGAPLGLPNSVSSGIVSALNRSITVSSSEVPEDIAPEGAPEESPAPFDFWNFDIPSEERPQATSSRVSLAVIQTDAAINQGNSGGALVNEAGQIIGINVAIASSGEGSGNIGLGFAIPSNLAQRVAQELIENGEASHGLLGASVSDATGDTSIDADVVGAVIQELSDGGAAAAAGLRVGDIVTGVNDIPITSSTDLTAQIRALAGGSEAEISYVRGGEAGTVQVTLGELG